MSPPGDDDRTAGVELRVEEPPHPRDAEAVVQGLVASNTRAVAVQAGWERRELGVLARRSGRVVGGALGQAAWAWLYVGRLWVTETLRGAGLGWRLMDELESAARARGCVGAWLDTFSFQARPFYESIGYSPFGELADFPPGHARTYLWKRL